MITDRADVRRWAKTTLIYPTFHTSSCSIWKKTSLATDTGRTVTGSAVGGTLHALSWLSTGRCLPLWAGRAASITRDNVTSWAITASHSTWARLVAAALLASSRTKSALWREPSRRILLLWALKAKTTAIVVVGWAIDAIQWGVDHCTCRAFFRTIYTGLNDAWAILSLITCDAAIIIKAVIIVAAQTSSLVACLASWWTV